MKTKVKRFGQTIKDNRVLIQVVTAGILYGLAIRGSSNWNALSTNANSVSRDVISRKNPLQLTEETTTVTTVPEGDELSSQNHKPSPQTDGVKIYLPGSGVVLGERQEPTSSSDAPNTEQKSMEQKLSSNENEKKISKKKKRFGQLSDFSDVTRKEFEKAEILTTGSDVKQPQRIQLKNSN